MLVAFPTGDAQAKMVGRHQPVTLAAMEGRFHGGRLAEVTVIGQPNVEEQRLENPIPLPGALSFLAYGTFQSYVAGLNEFPREQWPDNIELIYYAFHLMVTLGTIFIALMAWANWQRWRGRLATTPLLLWALMLAFPFPYLATTLGWMTAELGRQPWLIYGLLRTRDGYSKAVSTGDTVFTRDRLCGPLLRAWRPVSLFDRTRTVSWPGSAASRREHSVSLARTSTNSATGGNGMIALWYGILSMMITTYIVLDGRNFGAGILHGIVARTPAERRQVIAAIGPLWSWHEVWLVGTGGVMAMSFPRLMAVGFSGYYLALFLILWCVVLRGISIEVGGHMDDPLWQALWDVVFVGSNVLLAVLFGAALGNVVRGVPLTREGTFHLTFFTNVFRTRGVVGLLDWYTLSMAAFCVLMLTAHGATYLTMRTEGEVHRRAECLARRLWAAAIPAFGLIALLTGLLRPELLRGLVFRPLAWVPLGVCAVSIRALVDRPARTPGTPGVSWLDLSFVRPTDDGRGRAFSRAAVLDDECRRPVDRVRLRGSGAQPAIATVWWFTALALALTYLFIIQRYYTGKVNVSKDNQGLY